MWEERETASDRATDFILFGKFGLYLFLAFSSSVVAFLFAYASRCQRYLFSPSLSCREFGWEAVWPGWMIRPRTATVDIGDLGHECITSLLTLLARGLLEPIAIFCFECSNLYKSETETVTLSTIWHTLHQQKCLCLRLQLGHGQHRNAQVPGADTTAAPALRGF